MMIEKNVRSSQLLSPFGIGQIINFPGEVSLMVCGLDLWDDTIQQQKTKSGFHAIDENSLRIIEPRLQEYLKVDYFIKPFIYKKTGIKNNHLTIPAVRFPQWHHCTNQNCGRMIEVPLTFAKDEVICTVCSDPDKKIKYKMIPVRFVATCSNGHIQDVPYKEWVHNGPIPNDGKAHDLTYHALPGSGDLGSVLIKCSCGAKNTLAGLMNVRKNEHEVYDSALARIGFGKDDLHLFSENNHNNSNPSGQYCRGYRPWLGLEGVSNAQPCNKHLQVLIRGGSNVHYSNIISALYLPENLDESNEYLNTVINEIGIENLRQYSKHDSNYMVLGAVLENNLVVKNKLISKELLVELVINELENNDVAKKEVNTVLDLRIEEYEYILKGCYNEISDFKAIKKNFSDYAERDLLERYFECVVLVEKLKETRVFQGFSRINPANQIDKSELSKKTIKWLPAYDVYGEGIFIKFRDDQLDKWQLENGDDFNKLINRYQFAMQKRKSNYIQKDINASFVVLHTFAHMLIKKLCFNCGYGSSSLRERIYFSSDKNKRMNGILIYTSSGDSEGSLGGLVRQGKNNNLGKLVKDAINDARWCSADPVCSDIGQSSGQGPDNINGSACHNCCIVPETSCEEFNMLLDRATVIDTPESKNGFFIMIDKS